jgi:hypothetical protein
VTESCRAPACNSKDGVSVQISQFINRHGTKHPKCAVCNVSMWLARVESDKPDHDKCTFECPACESAVVEIIKYR